MWCDTFLFKWKGHFDSMKLKKCDLFLIKTQNVLYYMTFDKFVAGIDICCCVFQNSNNKCLVNCSGLIVLSSNTCFCHERKY